MEEKSLNGTFHQATPNGWYLGFNEYEYELFTNWNIKINKHCTCFQYLACKYNNTSKIIPLDLLKNLFFILTLKKDCIQRHDIDYNEYNKKTVILIKIIHCLLILRPSSGENIQSISVFSMTSRKFPEISDAGWYVFLIVQQVTS